MSEGSLGADRHPWVWAGVTEGATSHTPHHEEAEVLGKLSQKNVSSLETPSVLYHLLTRQTRNAAF